MCKLKNCCCCIDLRTGCIIIAIVEFFLVLANLSITAVPAYQRWLFGGWLVGTFALVLGVIFGLALWILLLFGALTNNSILVLINMVFVLVLVAVKSFAFIWLTVNFVQAGIWLYDGLRTTFTLGMLFYLIYYLLVIPLDIYFAVVIFNFYKALRYGGSGSSLPYPAWVWKQLQFLQTLICYCHSYKFWRRRKKKLTNLWIWVKSTHESVMFSTTYPEISWIRRIVTDLNEQNFILKGFDLVN